MRSSFLCFPPHSHPPEHLLKDFLNHNKDWEDAHQNDEWLGLSDEICIFHCFFFFFGFEKKVLLLNQRKALLQNFDLKGWQYKT